MKYYQLKIVKTARPMGNNHNWETYDVEKKEFKNVKEVKEYLNDQYYYCKTIKRSYIDDKEGNSRVSGYIYCFKSDPVSYDDCKHYEQHWVSLYKINSSEIDTF